MAKQSKETSELIPTRFASDWSPQRNMAKVMEEVAEMQQAYVDYCEASTRPTFLGEVRPKFLHLLEESTDVQMAVETFLASVGADDNARRTAKKQVIEKNAKRGYYSKAGGDSDIRQEN